MTLSDKIALAALIVSIAAICLSLVTPWFHAVVFDRPKLIADAHFDQYMSAEGKERRLLVTISNVGRRPVGVRHVALVLSTDAPKFVPASENPLRYNGTQLGVIARNQDDPLYLGEHESRNLPPLIIPKEFISELGSIPYLAVEDSNGHMHVSRVRNPYYPETN